MAEEVVGVTLGTTGEGSIERAGTRQNLKPEDPILQDDTIRTGAAAFATLRLVTEARIDLGPLSEITLDAFTAALGGSLRIKGNMVFDRPDDLPPVDHTIFTAFSQIGVRGTRFFYGISHDVPAVFAARGEVSVTRGTQSVILGAGDGVEVLGTEPGGTILLSLVQRWSDDRVAAAYASVGL